MASLGRNRKLLFASGALLCVIAAGASLAAFASPGGQHAGSQNPAVADATGATAPPGTGQAGTGSSGSSGATSVSGASGVTSNGIATSAMQYPLSNAAKIKSWVAGSGGTALLTVTGQLGNVTQSAALKLYSQMRAECAQLSSSVRTAQSAPPIPDTAMQQQYASALTALATATAGCQSAISVQQIGDEGQVIHVNSALLTRSLAELTAGSKQLYTATAEIRTLRR